MSPVCSPPRRSRSAAMPSPFPGMNPYLEQAAHWHDFHTEFLTTIRHLLIPQVGRSYIVQLEEHVYIHEMPQELRARVEGLTSPLAPSKTTQPGGAAVRVLEAPPGSGVPDEDEERIRFLEVRDRRGRELVTVIELLSPSKQVGRRGSAAVLDQTAGNPSTCSPPGRNRPPAWLDSDADDGPACVRLLSGRQSGRTTSVRRILGDRTS